MLVTQFVCRPISFIASVDSSGYQSISQSAV